MASASDIRAGRAYVELYVRDSKLVAGLNAIGDKMRAFGVGAMAAGGAMMGLASAIAAPLATAARTFADYGSQLYDMSARTGLSTEALSELGYAAKMTGGSLEGIEKSARKMSAFMLQVDRGSKNATNTLQQLGVSAEALGAMTPEDQLIRLGDALSRIEDPGRRAALAMQIFGKTGTEMLPMFAGGAEGLRKLREEAKAVGASVSSEDAAKADELGDAWDRLKTQFHSTAMTVGAALAPALTRLLGIISGVTTSIQRMVRAHSSLVPTTLKVAAGAAAAGGATFLLGQAIWVASRAFAAAAVAAKVATGAFAIAKLTALAAGSAVVGMAGAVTSLRATVITTSAAVSGFRAVAAAVAGAVGIARVAVTSLATASVVLRAATIATTAATTAWAAVTAAARATLTALGATAAFVGTTFNGLLILFAAARAGVIGLHSVVLLLRSAYVSVTGAVAAARTAMVGLMSVQTLSTAATKAAAAAMVGFRVATTAGATAMRLARSAVVGLATGQWLLAAASHASSLAMAALSAAAAALGVLTSPVGLAVAAIAGLGYAAYRAVGGLRGIQSIASSVIEWLGPVFQRAGSRIGSAFREVVSDVGKAWKGVSDAITAGDVEAATKVITTTLRLEWAKAVGFIKGLWGDFKLWWHDLSSSILGVMADVIARIQILWTNALAEVEKAWAKWTSSTYVEATADLIAPIVAKLYGVDPQEVRDTLREDFERRRQRLPQNLQDIDAEAKKKTDEIEARRQARHAALAEADRKAREAAAAAEAKIQADVEAARKERDDALQRAAAARAEAEKKREETQQDEAGLGLDADFGARSTMRTKNVITFSGYELAGMGSRASLAERTARATELVAALIREARAHGERLTDRQTRALIQAIKEAALQFS